jgi:hypothetical protein
LEVEHEEMVVLTTFIVKDISRLFLTNLHSRVVPQNCDDSGCIVGQPEVCAEQRVVQEG